MGKKIINIDDITSIDGPDVKHSDKVHYLLSKIEGPLKSGNLSGFYVMLDIMESYGVQATKELATEMKDHLGIQSKFLS